MLGGGNVVITLIVYKHLGYTRNENQKHRYCSSIHLHTTDGVFPKHSFCFPCRFCGTIPYRLSRLELHQTGDKYIWQRIGKEWALSSKQHFFESKEEVLKNVKTTHKKRLNSPWAHPVPKIEIHKIKFPFRNLHISEKIGLWKNQQEIIVASIWRFLLH